ncbi:uncharacterized protein TNCV_4874841 [Trichonephila clavipes]|nr:uncharacterized protein TNCV_4874841 [Trichonephila clavipes]
MPSPVQSNCDAHDTIANGQYGAAWSMGHTQQVCVRIVLLPYNIWQLNLSRAETPSRWCGVVVRRGGGQLRCRPRHLTMVQNYVVRRQKPSCS